MSIKSTTLFILIFFSVKTISASCRGGQWVDLFPRNTNISTNTIFLIDFAEKNFKFKNKVQLFKFFAITKKGKRISLNVLQSNFSGTMGQVLLKASKPFRIGDSVSIFAILPTDIDTKLSSNFQSQIKDQKWLVSYEADNEPPLWDIDSITYKFEDRNHSSVGGNTQIMYSDGGGFSYIFNCPVSDNLLQLMTYYREGFKSIPMLYEITFNNEKCICASVDLTAIISSSNNCGRNFTVSKDKIKSATIRPMDSSGNFGKSKTVFFEDK